MTVSFSRRLDFEGAVNFRDLGGYPTASGRHTRWRRLFRADGLNELSPADLAQLKSLGLRGVVDLRVELERRARPDRLPEGVAIAKLEAGFFPTGTLEMLARAQAGSITADEIRTEVAGHYRRFVTDHAEPYRQLLAFAADAANLPLVIHCTSGKDRTGFGSAVILLALGVPRDIVEQDYLLTNQYRRDVSHLFGPKSTRDVIDLLLSAQPAYFHAALDEIDSKFGSFDAYLAEALGVDTSTRERLTALLTE